MHSVFLLTGGNIGDRKVFLREAASAISNRVGHINKTSSLYETEPWGLIDQQPFLNQVLCTHTELQPHQVLQTILTIELELGRERREKMGPRTIDIDILFYDDLIVTTADLIIPHPHIAARRFVLIPLSELAPTLLHPVHQKTIMQLLSECNDHLQVLKTV